VSDAGACREHQIDRVIELELLPFLSPRVQNLDAALAIIKELKDDHRRARRSLGGGAREVPLGARARRCLSCRPWLARADQAAGLVAGRRVRPRPPRSSRAASRAYPDAAAALVARLLPLLRKAGFSDEQVAGEQQQAPRATPGPQGACV